MTDELKLCKDCKWYSPKNQGWLHRFVAIGLNDRYDMCVYPPLIEEKRSPVTGEVDCEYAFCHLQREFSIPATCGPDGRYWEANE